MDALKGSLARSDSSAKSKSARRKRKRSKSLFTTTQDVGQTKRYRNVKQLPNMADVSNGETVSPYRVIQLMCCFGSLRLSGQPGTVERRAIQFFPPVVALGAETIRHVLDMQAAEVPKALVSMAAVQRFVLRVMRLQLLQLRDSALATGSAPLFLLQVRYKRKAFGNRVNFYGASIDQTNAIEFG